MTENEDISKKILNAIIINNGIPKELFNRYSNSINFNEAVNEFEGKTYAEEIALRFTKEDIQIDFRWMASVKACLIESSCPLLYP